jgi:hypothetical protein
VLSKSRFKSLNRTILQSIHVLPSEIVLQIAGEGDRHRIAVPNRKLVGTPFVPILARQVRRVFDPGQVSRPDWKKQPSWEKPYFLNTQRFVNPKRTVCFHCQKKPKRTVSLILATVSFLFSFFFFFNQNSSFLHSASPTPHIFSKGSWNTTSTHKPHTHGREATAPNHSHLCTKFFPQSEQNFPSKLLL